MGIISKTTSRISAHTQAQCSTNATLFPGERLELEKGYEAIGRCQGSSSVLAGKSRNEVLIPATWKADKTLEIARKHS